MVRYEPILAPQEAVWKDETAKTKKLLIQLDLVEPLGEIPLVNFDKFSLQLHLNKLAATGSKDRVLQMRAYPPNIPELKRTKPGALPLAGSVELASTS